MLTYYLPAMQCPRDHRHKSVNTVGVLLATLVFSLACDRKPSSPAPPSASAKPAPTAPRKKQEPITEAEQKVIESGMHLRQIGTYMTLYERENGRAPEKLEELVKVQEMPAGTLTCPRPGFEYVYTGKPVTKSPEGTVIAYERGPTEDVQIMVAGGGVQKYPAATAQRIIKNGRLDQVRKAR